MDGPPTSLNNLTSNLNLPLNETNNSNISTSILNAPNLSSPNNIGNPYLNGNLPNFGNFGASIPKTGPLGLPVTEASGDIHLPGPNLLNGMNPINLPPVSLHNFSPLPFPNLNDNSANILPGPDLINVGNPPLSTSSLPPNHGLNNDLLPPPSSIILPNDSNERTQNIQINSNTENLKNSNNLQNLVKHEQNNNNNQSNKPNSTFLEPKRPIDLINMPQNLTPNQLPNQPSSQIPNTHKTPPKNNLKRPLNGLNQSSGYDSTSATSSEYSPPEDKKRALNKNQNLNSQISNHQNNSNHHSNNNNHKNSPVNSNSCKIERNFF